MPAPMSLDRRLRIVSAVEGGSSIRAAALRFCRQPSVAIKLLQRVRATGSAALARYGGTSAHAARAVRGRPRKAGRGDPRTSRWPSCRPSSSAAFGSLDHPQDAAPDRPEA